MKRKNPLFGFLTSRKEPFKQESRGEITYHRDVKSERAEKKKKLKGLTAAQKKIISRGLAADESKNKELLPLFEMNPSWLRKKLRKGIKGTIKVIGKGKKTRLEILEYHKHKR